MDVDKTTAETSMRHDRTIPAFDDSNSREKRNFKRKRKKKEGMATPDYALRRFVVDCKRERDVEVASDNVW